MGGSDHYCFLSALHHFDTVNDLYDHFSSIFIRPGTNGEDYRELETADRMSRQARYILRLESEDVKASRDLAVLSFSPRDSSGNIIKTFGLDDADEVQAPPDRITEKTSAVFFNVEPGPEHSYGIYTRHRPGLDDEDVVVGEENFHVTYAALVIALAAAPELKVHHLHDLMFHLSNRNNLSFPDLRAADPDKAYYYEPERSTVQHLYLGPLQWINYGRIARTVHQTFSGACVAENPFALFPSILGRTDLSLQQKRTIAWLGEGNLWSYAAPNRFPISEVLDSDSFMVLSTGKVSTSTDTKLTQLPNEILFEICHYLTPRSLFFLLQLNRSLRANLLPNIHKLTFKAILCYTPHLLPAGPFTFEDDPKRGREELDFWTREWAKGGYDLAHETDWKRSKDVHRVPWLLYAREATRSASMRNRRRIWGIALQFAALYKAFLEKKVDLEQVIPSDP